MFIYSLTRSIVVVQAFRRAGRIVNTKTEPLPYTTKRTLYSFSSPATASAPVGSRIGPKGGFGSSPGKL